EFVRWSLNLRVDHTFVVFELHEFDRELVRSRAMKIELGGEVERFADAARHVGDAEAGEHVIACAEIIRWKCDRHMHNGRFLSGARGDFPERSSLTAIDHAGTRGRN